MAAASLIVVLATLAYSPLLFYFSLPGLLLAVLSYLMLRRAPLWRKALAAVLVIVLSVATTFGYFIVDVADMKGARVEPGAAAGNWEETERNSSYTIFRAYGFLPVPINTESRLYSSVDSDPSAPPYPGIILIITLKAPGQVPPDALTKWIDANLKEAAKEGLTITEGSRVEGDETLSGGAVAHYIIYDATMPGTGTGTMGRFTEGAKLKLKAMHWPDEARRTTVIGMAFAQTGYVVQPGKGGVVGIGGQQPDDWTTWNAAQGILHNSVVYG